MKFIHLILFAVLVVITHLSAQRMIVCKRNGEIVEYSTNDNTTIKFADISKTIKVEKIFEPQFKQRISSNKIAFSLKLLPLSTYKFTMYTLHGRQIFSKYGTVSREGVENINISQHISHGIIIMRLESHELSFSRKLVIAQ